MAAKENWFDNWQEEPYVKEWFSKSSKVTSKNYGYTFPKWLAFINISKTRKFTLFHRTGRFLFAAAHASN